MGRKKKDRHYKEERKRDYDSWYYETRTKIKRQLSRNIQKELAAFNQADSDRKQYRWSLISHLKKFNWSHFLVLKEDVFSQKDNALMVSINKKIKTLNQNVESEYKLPAIQSNKRSLVSLAKYTEKYFNLLYKYSFINRAVWFFEITKSGVWHVHALVDFVREDTDIQTLEEYWLLNDKIYCEAIKDLEASFIYITKEFKPSSNSGIDKSKVMYNNMIGYFSNSLNPLRINTDNNIQRIAI